MSSPADVPDPAWLGKFPDGSCSGFPGAFFHRLLLQASCLCQAFAVQVKALLRSKLCSCGVWSDAGGTQLAVALVVGKAGWVQA